MVSAVTTAATPTPGAMPGAREAAPMRTGFVLAAPTATIANPKGLSSGHGDRRTIAKPMAIRTPPPSTMVRSPSRAMTGPPAKRQTAMARLNKLKPMAASASLNPLTVER